MVKFTCKKPFTVSAVACKFPESWQLDGVTDFVDQALDFQPLCAVGRDLDGQEDRQDSLSYVDRRPYVDFRKSPPCLPDGALPVLFQH